MNRKVSCRIFRFKSGENPDCCLLGYEITSSRKYTPKLRGKYCFHLQCRKADYIEYGGSRLYQSISSLVKRTRFYNSTWHIKWNFSSPTYCWSQPTLPPSINNREGHSLKLIVVLLTVPKLTMCIFLFLHTFTLW